MTAGPARGEPVPVVLVGPLPPLNAGMSAQMLRWAEGLRGEGHRVTVVDTRPKDRHKPVRRWLSYLFRLLGALPRGRWLSVHSGSDVYFFAFTTPAILLGRLFGRRVLVTYKGGRAEPFLTRHPMAGRFLRLAHRVIVPSSYLRRVLLEKTGVTADIVPNILLLDPAATERIEDREGPRLLVTRNFEEMYDIPTAMRAFTQIRRSVPGARLDLFGDGPDRAALEKLAGELDGEGITFHGNRPYQELSAWYARASLVLNPSTVDNTPNSLVEAMAFGIPIVSTNVGGIPDLTDGGRAASLVPPRDPEAMAQAALALLNHPEQAKHLRDHGFGIVERFRWPRVYQAFVEVASGD